jgi:recombination protein RecA
VFRLVLEAQRCAEPVVWVSRRESVFYPPDAADAGVDLDALAVVWAAETRLAARAADHLLRSGGFGLVVLDVGADDRMPPAFQTRLAGLAQKHGAALLCITEKDARRPSLGSLVSLRAEAVRTERAGERFRCEVRVLKDKRRGPGWKHVEVCRGPAGLC